ncbi:MAG: hypothetical protein AAB540_03080 [Patescibacteria group bacterium]
MPKKTDKKIDFQVKMIDSLPQEEKEAIDTMIIADIAYDAVISRLDISKDDELYKALMLGILKRQTKNHIVLTIWKNLTKEQIGHLKNMIDQSCVTMPEISTDDVIIEFALMYPELMAKIRKNLSIFFKDFITEFNALNAA